MLRWWFSCKPWFGRKSRANVVTNSTQTELNQPLASLLLLCVRIVHGQDEELSAQTLALWDGMTEIVSRESPELSESILDAVWPLLSPDQQNRVIVTAQELMGHHESDQSSDTCAICLGEDNDDDMTETRCGHTFHSNCLRQWAQRASTCPMCRAAII